MRLYYCNLGYKGIEKVKVLLHKVRTTNVAFEKFCFNKVYIFLIFYVVFEKYFHWNTIKGCSFLP